MNNYILFDKPKKAFNKIFEKINSAKKSVYVETYRISNDLIGKELINLLIKKSLSGVKVKIIVDYLGWGNFSTLKKEKIKKAGIELVIFNPLFQKISWTKMKKFWNIHLRDHRKLIIIDDKYAFVGGMNFTSKELKWRDLMVEISGPILENLISSSHEIFGIAKRKHFKKRKIFKRLTKEFERDDILVRQIPYSKHKILKKELTKIFNLAKTEICIVTPYLVPDLPFRRTLKKAAKRKIKIKIIIPKSTDLYIADLMNHFGSYLLNKINVKIYLYPGMIHSKYVIVDDKICSFGSANLDYQTFNHNYELNIISANKNLIKQLKKSFKIDFKKSKRYEEKSYKKRNWIHKLITKILIKHKRHF